MHKMSTKVIQELANISTLRNHLWFLINGSRNLVQRADVSELNLLIQKLDHEVIEKSLNLLNSKYKDK